MRSGKKTAKSRYYDRAFEPAANACDFVSGLICALFWMGTLGIALGLGGSGCGGAMPAGSSSASKKETVEMEELHITAHRGSDGAFEFQVYDASELFNRATEFAKQRRCEEALVLYQKIENEFAASSYLSPSLYNAGLCLQNSEKFPEAAEYYRKLCERVPDAIEAKDARFQLLTVLSRLGRWLEALVDVETLLARTDLSPADRLEALAQRASALLELGRLEEAEAEARGAVDFYRTRPADQAIGDAYYAAQASYVVAETFRRRAAAMQFPAADVEAQRQVLMRRAELVLEAQRQYFAAIQFQNARWAAAAGFRIGQMYDELWQAITNAPAPESLSREARDLYRSELAKLIEPLTRHAIRYWELTLMMIERTGVNSEWTEQTKKQLEKVRERLLAPPSAEGSTPAPDAGAAEPAAPPPQDFGSGPVRERGLLK